MADKDLKEFENSTKDFRSIDPFLWLHDPSEDIYTEKDGKPATWPKKKRPKRKKQN